MMCQSILLYVCNLSSKSLLYSDMRYPRYLKSVTCSIILSFITIFTLCISYSFVETYCLRIHTHQSSQTFWHRRTRQYDVSKRRWILANQRSIKIHNILIIKNAVTLNFIVSFPYLCMSLHPLASLLSDYYVGRHKNVYCCELSCVLLWVVLCVLLWVVLCVLLSPYVYLLYYVCIAVFFTSDIGLLARSQYSEGPETGHLDTGFSRFPCVYKQMLRSFPSLQVATTCFSCSPPDLNLLVTNFIFCIHVK